MNVPAFRDSAQAVTAAPYPAANEDHRAQASHHETADDYRAVLAHLSDRWRVVACKDRIQWILQGRDGKRAGRPRWTGVRYFRTREALMQSVRGLCGAVDPAALATLAFLPNTFAG